MRVLRSRGGPAFAGDSHRQRWRSETPELNGYNPPSGWIIGGNHTPAVWKAFSLL
ncbi:hypothetical protein BHAP_0695 [Bifidobacterium hapali]|uniref:Uncharacterized protein n=1 Tax=Bifidobacterium hapali TaxID=1630172 RepID=A0A261G185_9BIFI|nr:hypothetical protein BHAP_0695 [Bifidobacterium hapali]